MPRNTVCYNLLNTHNEVQIAHTAITNISFNMLLFLLQVEWQKSVE